MSLEAEYYGDKKVYSDPYCYNGTDVLINERGIRDSDMLADYERGVVARRLLRLHIDKKYGDFSPTHYLGLHKYLFHGVYPFAGKIRTNDIIKGYTYFARYQYIEGCLQNTLEEMKSNIERCTNKEEYACLLGKHYLDLNLIHPFREGNGRVQREFLREFVEETSKSLPFGPMILDYSKVDKERLLFATINSIEPVVSEQISLALTSVAKIR